MALNTALLQQLQSVVRANRVASTMMQIRSAQARVFVSNYW